MKRRSSNNGEPFGIFLQNNPHPMWIFDHQTLKFLDVNPAAVANYGYSRSEFLKMKITQIRPQDQIPNFLAGIRPFRVDGTLITERQHLTKDRRIIDVLISASQFYFQGQPAVVVEAQDITGRKQNEEFLRKIATLEEENCAVKNNYARLVRAMLAIVNQLEAAQAEPDGDLEKTTQTLNETVLLARQSLEELRQSKAGLELSTMLTTRVRRSKLTSREKEVLCLLTAGKSNKEIASELEVAEGTVKLHVNHILRKLKTAARTEAAVLAIRTGIVPL